MSVRRERRTDPATGAVREFWMVDVDYQSPDGRRMKRIRKVAPVQTRRGAEQYEREVRIALADGTHGARKEVPTFDEWFNGRFWQEWVIANKNKPGEQEQKKSIYRTHLKSAFGDLLLDEIDETRIARFKAALVERKRSDGETPALAEKTINNVLAVLSKPLHYAASVRVIPFAPRVGMFKVERPEYVCWEMEQYARILAAAVEVGAEWYVAACLAGEAGLRVGEVRALRWREDVDLVAGTLTVNQQARHGWTGTPKGRTRRTLRMTPRLLAALKGLSQIRTGYVVRNLDGTPVSDGQTSKAIYRITDAAGLPPRGWHVLRHSFGTHAAQLGANPWTLMTWMGHKRIDETMLYVNLAHAHARPIPREVLAAAGEETDPDRRILLMLGARGSLLAYGNLTATEGEATSTQRR